jgi:hypothetical protein
MESSSIEWTSGKVMLSDKSWRQQQYGDLNYGTLNFSTTIYAPSKEHSHPRMMGPTLKMDL